MLVASRQTKEFDRRDVLRDILEARLDHMSNRFWQEDEEKMRTTGSPMKFDDLLVQIQRWMTVLNNKGMAHKRPISKTAISFHTSSFPAKPTYAEQLVNSPPKQQSTGRCNICGSIHATEDCLLLVNSDVEARLQMLSNKGLCYHCFEPNHQAKGCAKKALISCAICKKRHSTLLHDRRYVSSPKTTVSELPFRSRTPSRESNAAANVAATPSAEGVFVNPRI